MNLKNKILIGAALLVAIPIIISSSILGYTSSSQSFAALERASKSHLTATRDLTKARIVDYLSALD
ncbi:MAG: hypothetical protein HRU25_05670 [Psychrobium sp.]|nr:hypothetical protein [Psychrobium sp.]